MSNDNLSSPKPGYCKAKSRPTGGDSFRPPTHDNDDDSFDYRLIASVMTQKDMKERYKFTLYHSNSPFLEALREGLHDFNDRKDLRTGVTTKMIIVNSSLSDVDKKCLIHDVCINYIEKNFQDLIVVKYDNLQSKILSGNDLTKYINEDFSYKLKSQASRDKRLRSMKRSRKLSGARQSSHETTTNFDPISVLKDLLLKSTKYNQHSIKMENNDEVDLVPGLVIVLESLESITHEALADFISNLTSSNIRFHIIAFNSEFCIAPFHLHDRVASIIDIELLKTTNPWTLYDNFISGLLSFEKSEIPSLPVTLTYDIVAWVHEYFWRSSGCLHLLVDKLNLCLLKHFAHRKSLLSMFKHHQFLEKSQIIKVQNKGPEKTIFYESNISKLIGFMGLEDIGNLSSQLRLSTIKNGNIEQEITAAQKTLLGYFHRDLLDRFLLKCFKTSRDICMPELMKEYCSDILWIGIITSKEILKVTLPPDASLERFKSGLHDFFIDLRVCMTTASVLSIQHLLHTWSELIRDYNTSNGIDFKYLPLLRNIFVKFEDSVAEKLKLVNAYAADLKNLVVDENLSSKQIVAIVQDGAKLAPGIMQDYPIFDSSSDVAQHQIPLLDFIIIEIVEVFQEFVSSSLGLQRCELPGVLEFSAETVDLVRRNTGTIRKSLATSCMNPELYVKEAETIVSDTSIIGNIVMSTKDDFKIYNLFQEFCKVCISWTAANDFERQHGMNILYRNAPTHSSSSSSSASQAVLPSFVSGDVFEQDGEKFLRYRFFQALLDIEKTGLLRVKEGSNGNLIVQRQVFVWVGDSV